MDTAAVKWLVYVSDDIGTGGRSKDKHVLVQGWIAFEAGETKGSRVAEIILCLDSDQYFAGKKQVNPGDVAVIRVGYQQYVLFAAARIDFFYVKDVIQRFFTA